MCGSAGQYVCEIHKMVPGTTNFALAVRVPGQFNSENCNMPEQVIPLAQLCNADKSAQIKFVIASPEGREFNSMMTTINDLEAGRTTL